MVSPHPQWEDLDDGYAFDAGNVRIVVHPVTALYTSDGGVSAIFATSEEQANAYSVALHTAVGYIDETHREIVQFGESRQAWEFAHLLTHCLIEREQPEEDIQEHPPFRVPDDTNDVWQPTGIIEGRSAMAILEKIYEPMRVPEGIRTVSASD